MSVVLDAIQQISNAAASIAPPNSNPAFFWGVLILVFGILYVALSKVHMFQETKWKPIRMIIALIIAYFAASSAFTTVLLAKMFPNFAIVITAIIVFLILAGMLGLEDIVGNKVMWLVLGLALWWIVTASASQYIEFVPGIDVFQSWELIDWILVGGAILAIMLFIPEVRDATLGKLK